MIVIEDHIGLQVLVSSYWRGEWGVLCVVVANWVEWSRVVAPKCSRRFIYSIAKTG